MYKLMVVDDFPMEGQILEKMLTRMRLPVEYVGQALTGASGIRLARKVRPDIIVADIRMPEMNGIAFSRYIKEYEPQIKIIMLTAYDDFSYVQQSLRAGVDDYLLKPVSRAEFKEVLERVCARSGEPEAPAPRQPTKTDADSLASAVKAGDLKKLQNCCDDLFGRWQSESMEEQDIFCLAKDVLHDLEEKPESMAGDVVFRTFVHDICLCPSRADMQERFYTLMETCVRKRHPEDFSSSTRQIAQAKIWIDAHLSEEISLNKLAAEVYLSPSYLSKLFKKVERMTFSDYVLTRRMELAKNLLLSTQDTIESVAAQCGYDKSNSFWRIFKQKEGLSPAHYRAINGGYSPARYQTACKGG